MCNIIVEIILHQCKFITKSKRNLETQRRIRIAIAAGRAADADAAMVSVGGYNEAFEINGKDVNAPLFAGELDVEAVNVFRTRYEQVAVLEMTGAEIKTLAEGGFDIHGTGNPFPYELVVRGGAELADDEVYRLAVGDEELAPEALAQATELVDVGSQKAALAYLSELGTFTAEDITWE